MAVVTKTYTTAVSHNRYVSFRQKFEHLMKELDFSYFAFISFCIAIGACLGGGLVKFSLEYQAPFWQFTLGTSLALLNIIACVAQFPVRWIFAIFVSSTLINACLILAAVFL